MLFDQYAKHLNKQGPAASRLGWEAGKGLSAFLDADAMARWLPPDGFTGKVHHLDAKVGGTFKMSFTNFTTGKSHSFGGEYLELVPHARIRYTDKFDDPNLPGEIHVTVSLRGRSRLAPNSQSSRKVCRTSFHWRPAILSGSSRS
jgi:uncharacterized protein YndB with AHSA1/START domain